MRVEFIECKYRYQAKKRCPFVPVAIMKMCGGYMCFESWTDYDIWKNQK